MNGQHARFHRRLQDVKQVSVPSRTVQQRHEALGHIVQPHRFVTAIGDHTTGCGLDPGRRGGGGAIAELMEVDRGIHVFQVVVVEVRIGLSAQQVQFAREQLTV